MTITQKDLLIEFFKANPNRDIPHPEVVDWATLEYKKRTGNVFRDPDRGIRQLSQSGFLIKLKKGVYKYDPDFVTNPVLEDFTQSKKNEILKRDGYKCVICGRGVRDGVELHVDHIRPKDLGGKANIKNGQTLCSQHNFMKKNLRQTETGKKMFIRLYQLAQSEGNKELQDFCTQILEVFEKNNINSHIRWNK